MSLSKENKLKLRQTVDVLIKKLEELSSTPVDFIALDLIEVAIGLIERQLEMNIEFISEDSQEEPADFLFIEGEDNDIELAPHHMKSLEDVAYTETNDNQNMATNEEPFAFLDETDDTPSPDELNDWWGIDYIERDNK